MTEHNQLPINQLSRSDFELMAPVGSWESLVAAQQGGADAIYFGIENLNMRSKSSVNCQVVCRARHQDLPHCQYYHL